MHEFVVLMSGWAMHYLVHSAVVLIALGAAAWLGDRLLRRVGPQAQHRMWVAALFGGVALPLLPAAWLADVGHGGTGAAGGTVSVTYHMVAAAAQQWPGWPVLSAAVGAGYLLLVLLCLLRLAWRWQRTCSMARHAESFVLTEPMLRLLEDAARRAGVTAPQVRCSQQVGGPVVLGSQHPLLIVPRGFFEAENEDIAAALAHECAHIARRDYAKNLVYELVAVAVGYHPAYRIIRRRIAETRELVCDELAASGDRARYADSLLRLARTMAGPAIAAGQAIGVFDGDILEERIMRLTMDVPKVSRMRKIALAAVATCALLGGALAAVALPLDVVPQTATQEKIYKIGGDVKPPVLTHSVDAQFPDAERKTGKKGLQGVVVVALIVDSKGMPRDIHVKRSLRPDFDKCAIDAVSQYEFDPAMRKGTPVAVAISIEVNFHRY